MGDWIASLREPETVVYLCDYGLKKGSSFRNHFDYSLYTMKDPKFADWSWPLLSEGASLWLQWQETYAPEDRPLSGVLADWLDDNRGHLLTGATGPDPAARLDLLIRWLREVRCFGRENVPA